MLTLVRELSNKAKETLDAMVSCDTPPQIAFPAEQTRCPICNELLESYKTTEERIVVTLSHGKFRAVEALRHCAKHKYAADPSLTTGGPNAEASSSTDANRRQVLAYHSQKLLSIIGPKRKYGFDLVAYVGQRYFFDCRNEAETKSELAELPHGVEVPSRSLDRLLGEYIWFVATVHRRSAGRLRELFEENGGYVLGVDGGCEPGGPVALLCQDSVTDIILDCFKIGSENEVEAKRKLRIVQQYFGDPLATMGDMCQPLRRARLAIWKDIKHFVCHYHFVADVGFLLVEHTARRDEISSSHITTNWTSFFKSRNSPPSWLTYVGISANGFATS